MRANERSAAAAGVAVSQVKLIAFALGGFLAGLGGAMLAYQQTSADYSSYTAIGSVTFFATVYIAGITCVSGGINAGVIAAGGIIYTLINNGVPLWIYVLLIGLLLVGIVQLVRAKSARAALAVVGLATIAAAFHHGPVELGVYYAAISGVLLILTVILNPEGIVGPVQAQLAALRAKLRARRSPAQAVQPVAAAVAAQADKADETAPAAGLPKQRRQPHDSASPLLTVSGVSVRYGGVVANEDVSFEVFPGEIVGLIGPNGAGKTTVIDAISFTCETATPAAAADRSLARTASIAAPSRLRRTAATPPATRSRTMRHRMPKLSCG